MELIKAQDYYNKAIAYLEGVDHGKPHEKNFAKAEAMLNEILNVHVGNILVLHTLGSLFAAKGFNGLAIQLFSQVVNAEEKFAEAWNNLGLAWKSLNNFEQAEHCLSKAAKYCRKEHLADTLCNLAAINLNRGRPEQALKWVDECLQVEPGHQKGLWHQGLAYLELRKWDVAWDGHEARLHGGSPGEIAVRNYHGPDGMTPEWDVSSPGFIVIHGEQGMGDEIMFSSCIPDAMKVEGTRFLFEPSPRMAAVFARSFPNLIVHGTDKTDGNEWLGIHGRPDFKIALGSLPKFFRRSAASFPGKSYLVADRAKCAWWGDKLKALGRRPNIGIAWQGGVEKTRFDARSFHPMLYAPLFQAVDANWISLQYDSTALSCVEEVKKQLSVKISHWPRAVEQINPETGKMNDLDELIALVSKLDLVVTVCQTAVHVAGALGVPTLCLTPSEPSWRYGAVPDETMPWYASVRLLRQARGASTTPFDLGTGDLGASAWTPVIERAARETQQLIAIQKAAAS